MSSSYGDIIISEVDPSGSGTATYAADFFELTNTGSTAVNIAGWKMDDNSNAFATAVPLRGVGSIAAGQSVIFLEGTADGSTDATIQSNFKSAWFGSNVPASLVLAGYGGSGVGLGTGGDAVNIFNAGGTLITRVDFGSATTGVTFDNALGLNNVTLTTLSTAGVNGAFLSPTGEIGSPGTIPEPGTLLAVAFAGVGLMLRRRRTL
ncbi:MAG TPA: lamin tail domain-containing protein [Phycisphaerae bacterium]